MKGAFKLSVTVNGVDHVQPFEECKKPLHK